MRPKKNPKAPAKGQKRLATASEVYDTMKQAEANTGVPLPVLKAAKEAGCPGFRHNRVYWREVGPWLEAHPLPSATSGPPVDIADARFQEVIERVRKLRLVNDEREGKVIDRGIVAGALAKMCAEWNAIRTRSEAEAPARMAGLEAAECRQIYRGVMDEIGQSLADCARFFAEDDGGQETQTTEQA